MASVEILLECCAPRLDASADMQPVSCAIPFRRGGLLDVSEVLLRDQIGRPAKAQLAAVARWSDGSIKWLSLAFEASAAARRNACQLDTATVETSLPPRSRPRNIAAPLPVDTAWRTLDIGGQRLECIRNGLLVGLLSVRCRDDSGAEHVAAIESWEVGESGPLHRKTRISGKVSLGGAHLNVQLIIWTYVGSPLIRCEVSVHNPRRAAHPGNYWELGDAGSVAIRSLEFVLDTGSPHAASWLLGPTTSWTACATSVSVHQQASGGPHWASTTHVDRTAHVQLPRPGYILRTDVIAEGSRIQPAVQLGQGEGAWSASLLRFWEEFPSSIETTSSGEIVVGLWPEDASRSHELQGGERKTRTVLLAQGSPEECRRVIEQGLNPLDVHCDCAHLRSSGVLPFLDADEDARHTKLLREALEGPDSFYAKRERQDEYGWRHFGDLVADHESAFAGGKALVSHYNNQYDAIAGFGFQYLRTGNPRWFRLMDDLARHVADIDIYHTQEDKPAYNGGLFWHTYHYVDAGRSTHRSYPRAAGVPGGGPSAEHNYNAGLALHYYLTGSGASRDAAISLARWVIAMEDGGKTPFRWLARGDTGLASASGNPLYHGPGRAAGNSINALMVGLELTGDARYLAKAEQLIRRCIHPTDDIGTLDLLDAERRWYYTVFLEALGNYLWRKKERGELDGMYSYARKALLHYAAWMLKHEYPYLERPEILEYPTETWSAQDIRKSEVLAWAAACLTKPERQRFLEGSRRFLDDVLTRLPSLPTHKYTRPMVLMLGRGYAYDWASKLDDAFFPPAGETFPPPVRFKPQKAVALQRAKVLLLGLGGTSAAVLYWLLRP